ncbi:hypothetical protein RHS03_08218, partial [Rhizoctonia solani]
MSTPTCTCLNVGDNVYMIDPTTHCTKKGANAYIACTTSGKMPNIRWNSKTKDTVIPFPSLKKDKLPAAAAPLKPIIAPTPVLASSSKGPGPMDLDGKGFASVMCHVCGGKGHFACNCPLKSMLGHVANVEWSWERPKEGNCSKVVSDEELGKGQAKAN